MYIVKFLWQSLPPPPPPGNTLTCLCDFSFARHALSHTLSVSLTLHPKTPEDNSMWFWVWENPKEIPNSMSSVSGGPGSPTKTGLVVPGGPGQTRRAMCHGAELRAGHTT